MESSELRKKYIEFFKSKGHAEIPSASLVPDVDSSSLFISSGMQPLVPYILGAEHPAGKRIVNSQKSFRIEDIEEVGDNRHTTFFEMLGNWSLGDYFKKEQLPWFFEFLVDVIGLDPEKIYVTVFEGDAESRIPRDEESAEIWKELFAKRGITAKTVELVTEERGSALGMQDGRIFYYGAKKNWWSRSGLPDKMPAGEPGGPDSEVFYEFSSVVHDKEFGAHCHPNCDCGRYMEVGNSVFMEYRKTATGTFEKLPQKNVDFGGGLERMVAASNNDPDIFHIDVFIPVIRELEAATGKTYDQVGTKVRKSLRIIADHLKAACFIIGDGVSPGKDERNYIPRRLIRDAMTAHYFFIERSINVDFFLNSVNKIIDIYKSEYPELLERKDEIIIKIRKEAEDYSRVVKLIRNIEDLKRLYNNFDPMIPWPDQVGEIDLDGNALFGIRQSMGVSWTQMRMVAESAGYILSEKTLKEYNKSYYQHQELSRTSSAGMFKGGLADHSEKVVRLHTATHLMNKALREVLGEHVWQRGSHINAERTRFDFTHPEKMTPEQIKKVEELVNGWISRDLAVKKEIMPLEEARKLSAIGAFGEKYGQTVSVYTVYDPKTNDVISREFCGGPHVEHTGVIGKLKIMKEEAIAAGIRRIKAVVE